MAALRGPDLGRGDRKTEDREGGRQERGENRSRKREREKGDKEEEGRGRGKEEREEKGKRERKGREGRAEGRRGEPERDRERHCLFATSPKNSHLGSPSFIKTKSLK